MKKTIFAVMAVIASLSFLATSCPKPEPTKEQLLCQSKGWQLISATSIPAFTNKENVTSENLFVSFFYPCELDDILYFNENYSSILNFGKLICDDQSGKDISLGNWRIIKNENVLEFHLPYFFNDDDTFYRLEGKIVDLSSELLIVRLPIDFGSNDNPAKGNKIRNDRWLGGAKGDDGKFEFTLTYKVAK